MFYFCNIEKEILEWEDEDVHLRKDDSSFSTSTVSSTSLSGKNCFFDITKIKQKIKLRNSTRKKNSKENENNEIMMETLNYSLSNTIMKSVKKDRNDIVENRSEEIGTEENVRDDFNNTGIFDFDFNQNFENGNPDYNFKIFQRERKMTEKNDIDLYDENDFENSTFKPWKIRISRAAVSSSTYVRPRNNKRKKKSISYFLMKGPTLQTIPEKVEMIRFKEAISVGKPKKCNHSKNDD